MEKGASQPGATSDGFEVRKGLKEYLTLGYVPDAVSMTLEYGNADYAIAQFARALGDDQKYSSSLRQARHWTNLFKPEKLGLWPRSADGSWHKELSEGEVTDMRQAYVEASAEQTLWMVNYNLQELIERIGGKEKAVARLDRFFTHLNAGMRWNTPTWATNRAKGFRGLTTLRARPRTARRSSAASRPNCSPPSPASLPGNDDAGSLSSWYVLSALGFIR